jgi:anti-sigma factor RsiW
MQCRKIQELLKADYLDGELKPQAEREILEHLRRCPECQKLEKELRAQGKLFQEAKQQQVPEYLWQNIRDAIYAQRLNQEEGVSRRILERLRDLLFGRRPVLVLASALSMIILAAVFAGSFIQKKHYQEVREGLAVYSLNGENGDLIDDLGTSIEEYFL